VKKVAKIEQERRFMEFITESDQAFYDKYLVNLTEEELERFMNENPEFMKGVKREDDRNSL
jgi:hypothetical protein